MILIPLPPPPPLDERRKQTTEDQRLKAAKNRIDPLLAAGDYPDALAAIRRETQKGVAEGSLSDRYLTALNGTLSRAETLRKEGAFEAAGRHYREAMEGYPRDPALSSRAALAPEQIMAAIDLCAAELMEDGLVSYRSGNLTEAVAIWKRLLLFHPRYDPAKTAVDTAEKQLNNLKSMEENAGGNEKK